MYQAGILVATSNGLHPFGAILHPNPRAEITYFINNPEDIPHDIVLALNCGERRAGVFKYKAEDQFAHYIAPQKVQNAFDN